jgi:hypothetical protein
MILLCATAAALALPPSPSADADVCKSFEAETTDATLTVMWFDPSTGDFGATIEGEGLGLHVGKMTITASATWTYVGPGLWWFEGTQTIVAASGDELYLTGGGWGYEGYADGDYEITGGTGRFEGASGQGSFDVASDGTATWDGTLCY